MPDNGDLRQQLVLTIDALAVVIEQLTERVATLESVLVEPVPRTGTPPSYLSGRWFRRDGTAYGQSL